MQEMHLEKDFPEIHGISVSYIVPHEEFQDYIQKIRKEGFPQFGSWITYKAHEYALVKYWAFYMRKC